MCLSTIEIELFILFTSNINSILSSTENEAINIPLLEKCPSSSAHSLPKLSIQHNTLVYLNTQ